MWFLARPYGRLQLRGTFLSLWDDLLPVIPEEQWLENLALVAEWLAGFGGRAIAEPPHIHWQSPSTFGNEAASAPDTTSAGAWQASEHADSGSDHAAPDPVPHSDLIEVNAETRDLSSYSMVKGDGSIAAVTHGAGGSANGATAAGPKTRDPEPGATSPTTVQAEDSQATDASGTGTAPTTAAANAPINGSSGSTDTDTQDGTAAASPVSEGQPNPAQRDPNGAGTTQESANENAAPKALNAADKAAAPNAPQPS
jgi:hypothetical protein